MTIVPFIFMFKGSRGSFGNEDPKYFNDTFEFRIGTEYKSNIEYLLDDVVTNNKTGKGHIITVIYNQTTTTDPDSIVNIKHSLDDSKDYEVSADYGSNGFINKIIIKDI